ncbi:MAG TPA: sensor domain-containing diguanylate cyclase, partial [Thermoanaerobaculia bacterium]|nr:sensor domain-containing diguanylate cyclase [Thermoanaerobaculia bacterium]
ILFPDAVSAPNGLTLLPAPALVKNLPRPISLVAVPLAYRGQVVGVLTALAGGRPRGLGTAILHSFEAVAVELALALTSTGLLQKERDSYRFLDRLREVGQSLTTTFDAPRIKQILCEQGVTLLKADAAQFWDVDPISKSLQITTRWGADVGGEVGRLIPADKTSHPVVRCFTDKTLVIASEAEAREIFPVSPGSAGAPLARAVVVPLIFQNELCGIVSVVGRRGAESWPTELPSRLSLLADSGAVALHNARLMKIIEQQTERDAQTGLYNRASILKRLEAEVRRAERGNRSVAVAHIKLDGLAEAVQKFGPSFGDSLLPKAASQLVHATRAVNVVGRDKFDRFWILILDATKIQALRAVEALQKNFSPAFDPRLEQANLKFSLSVGLAAYPEDAFDTPSLVLRAEEALDDAVRSGAGTIVQYGALADTNSGPPM